MLLRSSRRAGLLTKEALVGKILTAPLGVIGRGAMKHPRLALATTGGVAGGASFAIPAIQRGEVGMNPAYQQARRAGLVPSVTSSEFQSEWPGNWFEYRRRGGGPVWGEHLKR